MSGVPRYLLALDVEASGQGLRSNFLIQVGLALVEVQSGAVLARFSSYVAQPPGTVWEKRCVDEFWSKHPELFDKAKAGVAAAPSADQVASNLLAWVRARVPAGGDTRLVTDTAGFDLAWLDWLLGDRSHFYIFERDGQPVRTDVLDVGSWYLGLAGECDPEASAKAASLRALGVEVEPMFEFTHTHDAADDAAAIALRAAWVMRTLHQRSLELTV